MTREEKVRFNRYKKECKRAARDLCYPLSVLDKLDECTTELQLCNTMTHARMAATN